MTALAVIIATGLLLAMILNLALKPRVSAKVNTVFMVIAVVGGLYYYGVGLWQATGDMIITAIRTSINVLRMFVGVNDLSAIGGTSVVASHLSVVIFWVIHLLAFYSMASAALLTLGSTLLRHLRLLLSLRGDLVLIFGVDDDSIALGKDILVSGPRAERVAVDSGSASVVYVADKLDPAKVAEINNAGMCAMTGEAAVKSQISFLRRLRLRSRKLTVYATDPHKDKNLEYALNLKASLEQMGIDPQNTQITLPGEVEVIAPLLQASNETYGFGFVNVYDVAALTARALIRSCPPWKLVRFDENGRALEDFYCAILGFGTQGQAVLKELVMNAQFAGSTFHAAIFSPEYDDQAAYLKADCPQIFKYYDIKGYNANFQGGVFFDWLKQHLDTVKMVAICTEDETLNQELADRLMLFLARHQSQHLRLVLQCGSAGVCYQESVGSPVVRTNIHSLDLLDAQRIDRTAILSNATYDQSPATPWQKWLACDNLSRISSRATADFAPAFVHAAGSSVAQRLAGEWKPSEAMLQNLGETEHLRWCASQYIMGYDPMTLERFKERGARYQAAKAAGEPANIKIGKDTVARQHVCLIPWDELDALSELENSLTGRNVDYKQIDINNVLAVPRLLKAAGIEG